MLFKGKGNFFFFRITDMFTSATFLDISERIAGTSDYSRRLIWLPKYFLTNVDLWPETPESAKKMFHLFLKLLFIFANAYGVILYIRNNNFVQGSMGILQLQNMFQVSIKKMLQENRDASIPISSVLIK